MKRWRDKKHIPLEYFDDIWNNISSGSEYGDSSEDEGETNELKKLRSS